MTLPYAVSLEKYELNPAVAIAFHSCGEGCPPAPAAAAEPAPGEWWYGEPPVVGTAVELRMSLSAGVGSASYAATTGAALSPPQSPLPIALSGRKKKKE